MRYRSTLLTAALLTAGLTGVGARASYQITVQTLSEQLTATKQLTSTLANQQTAMRTAMTAVWNELDKAKVDPTGYPFGRILKVDPHAIAMEVGFPVGVVITAANGVEPSKLPAGTVAMTDYTGPYEKIGDAHQAIQKWIQDNGKTENGAPWEVYYSDPSDTAPDQLKFQVFYPIR
jgi:effector-binding domain-containing protein